MDFRLLGPLELWVGGAQQHLGSVKERCLLAALLCAEGAPVPADTLMRRAWVDVPRSGTATLQSNISRLRSRLRAAAGDQARIDFSARSYTLHVPPESVDLRRFRDLRRQARSAAGDDDIESAAALLHKAESLWRAEPLAEFAGGWAAAMRRHLTENLRQVREQRITWELDLGRHADLVAELYDLLAHERDPEPYARHLMLALHRCGRHGDALAVYRETRRRLSQVLGADPGPEMERLHQRILARDTTLQLARPEQRHSAAHPPDNLPRDVSDFSGRRHELAALLSMPCPETTALPLTVVHGMAGVGKTALITHASHRLRAQYPDGRLHIHLRAHHEQPPVDPADALAILLQAIGVASEELPATLDARAALWRERTAHRSVLLLLDDARNAAQIRPLLPGTATCRVFVTSRNRLADLEGAQSLALDVLDTTEASGMFTHIAGTQRTSDSSAVSQVVNLCNRYPLAIRLAANRFRHRDAWDIHDLAERLTQSVSPLDEIDTQSGIVTAFDFSYAELHETDQRLFRALALHPGPDLTLDVIAALTDVDIAQARRSVDELVGAHLLEEPIKYRYRLHDVVRDIAQAAGEHHDTPQERRDTVRRILDHYLTAADHSDRLAYPQRRRLEIPLAHPARTTPELDSTETALAWLDLNRGNLLAAAQLAAAGYPEHAMYFPHILDRAFHVWGMWEAAASLNATALAHARTHGDPAVTAQILIERAAMLRPQGAHREALRHATEALAYGQAMDDVWLQGEALEQTGIVYLVSGRLSDALQHFQEALPLHRQAGNQTGEAEALSHQGITWAHLGHLQQASRQFHAALEINQNSDNVNGQIKALNNIGEVHSLQGQQETAREYYERSLALVKKMGGRQELAILYNNLGNTCRDGNDTTQALIYFRMALENYQAIGDRAGQTDSLVNLGITHKERGQYDVAHDHLARADKIAQDIDDQHQRQRILAATAAIYHQVGQSEAALTTYRKALQAAQNLNRYEEAHTLEIIAGITEETKGSKAAEKIWHEALEIYRDLGLKRQAQSIEQHIDDPGESANR
ncbi:BTAD domain-containing putative transcriptional regulator [Streptomyces sp. NBS 14/10]|uniref:AfsR/SARP family transcriptional regulator n=1 Tax=Streptomyces sp. NBS 14/10 TaxID=1945643 RepID=UPI000B7FBC9C|nr:tetratricopeptide repeat protein [Streptomyces sp. NBS 14/10]KAK1178056.1 BTAD domain-containing putative transcriptional regulator [Streptomyces sp. NBS 14/10]